MRFLPKNPRAMHLFLLVFFFWKITEQAYIDEHRMEAFLEGSVDGIARGLKTTVNQTIENKFTAVNQTIENKFTAVNQTIENKFTAVNQTIENKFTAVNQTIETKFIALEAKNQGKISAFESRVTNLEQERIKDLALIRNLMLKLKVKGFQVKGHTYFNEFGNSCYSATTTPGQGSTGKSSWDDQRKKCRDAGGDLASVETQAEWEHIFNELKRLSLTYWFWLGGYCTGGNNYKWLSGSVVSNSNPAYWSGYPSTCSSANERHIRIERFQSYCQISECWKTVGADTNHAVCEYPC